LCPHAAAANPWKQCFSRAPFANARTLRPASFKPQSENTGGMRSA
jgi:hypothetical protein